MPEKAREHRSFRVTLEQYKVIMSGVMTLRRGLGDREMSKGRALELICADFLSGPLPFVEYKDGQEEIERSTKKEKGENDAGK